MGNPCNNETYNPTAKDFLALMKALSRPGTRTATSTATWQQRPHCHRRRVRFTTTDDDAAAAASVAATTTKLSEYHILLQNVPEGIVEKGEEREEEGVVFVRKEDLWYGSNDLSNFKTQKAKMSLLDKSPIQKRYAIERKRHMLLSIRCTLSAQKQGFNSDDIALVSQKCSEWCVQLAKIQGCHDYFDVYFPKLTSTLPNIATIRPTKFPFPIIQTNNNNSNTTATTNGNKKRRRVPQRCCSRTDEVATNEISSSTIMMDDDADTMQYRCVRQRRRRTSLTA